LGKFGERSFWGWIACKVKRLSWVVSFIDNEWHWLWLWLFVRNV
jgi:hypothetical protein